MPWAYPKMLDSVSQLTTPDEEFIPSNILLLNNVTLIGKSRFILKNNKAAYGSAHPDFRFKDIYNTYYFQEECIGQMQYSPRTERCYFPSLTIQAQLDGTWLSVMSCSAQNWMHWISESIPQLVATLPELKNWNFGLLLDHGLGKNMRDILDIVAPDTPRFEVHESQAVKVSHLIISPQHSGMYAVWTRPSNLTKTYQPGLAMRFPINGIHHFDAASLLLSRRILFQYFSVVPRKQKKMFILRKSAWRHMTNEQHIKTLLLERGFELVSPGEMSVGEQIRLFSTADIVVAQAGAALANMMFMPERSTVICIAVQNEHTNFDYFRDYAKIFGVTLEYVVGEVADPDKYNAKHIGDITHPMNAELSCPEDNLLKLLDKLD